MDVNKRFRDKYKIMPNGCWNWIAYVAENGYGRFAWDHDGRKYYPSCAHRYSYERYVGKLEKHMTIDHLCRNRKCVNPKHLEQVSYRTNLLRGNTITRKNMEKVFCKHGHKFTPENTRYGIIHKHTQNGKKYTIRQCRECNRRLQREYYHKLKDNSY